MTEIAETETAEAGTGDAEPRLRLRWASVASYHVVEKTFASRDSSPMFETLCGLSRRLGSEGILEELPLGSKSCETCLRLVASRGGRI